MFVKLLVVAVMASALVGQTPGTLDRTPVRTIVMKSGDTLSGIAKKVYGDSSFHHLLVEYNDRFGQPFVSPRRLRVGTRLLAPTPKQMQAAARGLVAPRFRWLSDRHCAAYCRLAAYQRFGLTYPNTPAWSMSRNCPSLWTWASRSPALERLEDLLDVDRSRFVDRRYLASIPERLHHAIADAAIVDLQPHLRVGCLIGFYYSASPQNGANREFTHMGLYVGENARGQAMVFHQFLGTGRATPLSDMWKLPAALSPNGAGHVLVARRALYPIQPPRPRPAIIVK